MKNKLLLSVTLLFFTFCFIIFYKSLNNSNIYIPKSIPANPLKTFVSKELFSETLMSSDQILSGSQFYLINIWASWCGPCIKEHSELIKLSKNPSIKLIGLNYKDNPDNAKKFIKTLGNPYSNILIDNNGTIAIELGAYGVPETFIINDKKEIIKKIVGPINKKILEEIKLILR
jgi:cytochrome c biogenesis protein CcmG, thiol:disulfide interchange protein DsbE